MRILNAILALLFMSFAFLQLNDPDPIIWILIYGAMAMVCVMASFEYYIPRLLFVLGIGYIVYSVLLLPGLLEWINSPDPYLLFSEVAKMQYVYIEEAREFMGLLICLIVLIFYIFRSRKRSVV